MKTIKITKTISVTKEDIVNGMKHVADSCPIAIAMTRTFENHVIVGTGVWKCGIVWGVLPNEVQTFIQNFDGGSNVEPISFDVTIIQFKS